MAPSPGVAPLRADQWATAHALVASERGRELLERCAAGTRECMALAATDDDGTLAGVVLFGEVAGALNTGSILWVVVRAGRRRRGIGAALLRQALHDLDQDGSRLVVAELPGDETMHAAQALLMAGGFELEGVVEDFYRDGVPLRLYRRVLE